MVKISGKKHSDAMEDLPDGLRDSRGRGEKERTPKCAKMRKKQNCRPKINSMHGKMS